MGLGGGIHSPGVLVTCSDNCLYCIFQLYRLLNIQMGHYSLKVTGPIDRLHFQLIYTVIPPVPLMMKSKKL